MREKDEVGNEAIRAEPVIRFLANAELTDPIWRDPRVVPEIFPGPYRVLFEAIRLAWQQELPRTSAIIARCTLELGSPLSESVVEDVIRTAEVIDSTGVMAQVELVVRERDRQNLTRVLSSSMRDLDSGVDPSRVRNELYAL